MCHDNKSYRNNEENGSPQVQRTSSVCISVLVSKEFNYLNLFSYISFESLKLTIIFSEETGEQFL